MFIDRNFFVDFESLFDIFARISGGGKTISRTLGSRISCLALNFRSIELLLCHYTNPITNKWWVKCLCWTRVFNCIFNRLYMINKKIRKVLHQLIFDLLFLTRRGRSLITSNGLALLVFCMYSNGRILVWSCYVFADY